jgi:hypothetical protein
MSAGTLTESAWLGDVVPLAVRGVGGRPAKGHVGRQRKLLCSGCGFIAYASAGAIGRAGGLPTCGCGGELHLPNLRDRAAVEGDALEAELMRSGPDAWNEACRELGTRDAMIVRSFKRDGGAEGSKRCEWTSCSKFSRGRFCPEHDPGVSGLGHYSERRGA